MDGQPMNDVRPVKVLADSIAVPAILALLQRSYAYMEARIDPPSSMHRLSIERIREQCASGEVWTIGEPPCACMFLTEKPGRLNIGKVAVDADMRGRGYAKRLAELAAVRAKEKGLPTLELETRIELHEIHEIYRRLGFVQIGEGTHAGFNRPTFVVMQKAV